MLFAFCILVGIYVGRKIGWALSKAILYPAPLGITTVVCILWGLGMAVLVHLAITLLKPGLIMKVISYGAGGYVATPNFGLFTEDTLPLEIQGRHQFVTSLPFVLFVLASLVLAFPLR